MVLNSSVTDQTITATDNYVTGSSLDMTTRKIGTILRWRLVGTKTATGTGVPTFNIRFGTGATVTDTARVTVTGTAQTAATDTAFFDVEAVLRQTGATTICAAGVKMHHTNGLSGFGNDENAWVRQATSTAFDITPANTKAGLSINPAAAGVWTFQVVTAKAFNLA